MLRKVVSDETFSFYTRCVDALLVTGISESDLGRYIANDPNLLSDIRINRELRANTRERYLTKLNKFMEEYYENDKS